MLAFFLLLARSHKSLKRAESAVKARASIPKQLHCTDCHSSHSVTPVPAQIPPQASCWGHFALSVLPHVQDSG